ncbi:MAG TPA: hypothetical protein VM261_33565 [Kofleriaceae bacterium]|nr:hypothetical protein [Kofleriaceae bacterium]
MPVLVFFAWIGVCVLTSWLTAFQMPDGFGNAIFMAQILGAIPSAGFMAMGLPTAIDPSFEIDPSGRRHGRPTRWPRRKGLNLVIAGGVIFLLTNVGGWFLDVAMGLPDRYRTPLAGQARWWAQAARPTLEPCLAKTWTAQAETCELRYRVMARGGAARMELRAASCPSPPIAACVRAHLDGGAFTLERRQLDSLEFAGAIDVAVSLDGLRGTGAPPPAERE